MKQVLDSYRARPRELEYWLGIAYVMAAMDQWDDDARSRLAACLVRETRANGTLGWLPFALDCLAEQYVHAGELSQATALLAESERIDPGIRAAILPYVSLLLAAWRGDAPGAAELIPVMTPVPPRAAKAQG